MGFMQMSVELAGSYGRIAALLVGNLTNDLRRIYWLGRLYLRWWDWGLVALLALYVRVPEALGMIYAVREVSQLPNTAYR